MYSILKRNLLGVGEFVVVPLHSFGKGLRKIMASDQAPYFFNYTLHKANMMFDLMKVRKSYKLWDFPDTGAVTTKKAVPKDINGWGGVKGGDSNLSKKRIRIKQRTEILRNIPQRMLNLYRRTHHLMLSNHPVQKQAEDDVVLLTLWGASFAFMVLSYALS